MNNLYINCNIITKHYLKNIIKILDKQSICNITVHNYLLTTSCIILFIIVFKIYILQNNMYISNNNYLVDLQNNWNREPIMEIYASNNLIYNNKTSQIEYKCNKYSLLLKNLKNEIKDNNDSNIKYTEEYFDNYIFEDNLYSYNLNHNIVGCDCRKSITNTIYSNIYVAFDKNNIKPNSCSYFDILNMCFNIKYQNDRLLNTWRGKNLCAVRKKKNFKLINIDLITKDHVCCEALYLKSAYCYIKNDDHISKIIKMIDNNTSNPLYNLLTELHCPINKIDVSNINSNNFTNTNVLNLTEDIAIKYNNTVLNKFFVYSDIQNNKVIDINNYSEYVEHKMIIDVKYSERKVCINPNEENIQNIVNRNLLFNNTDNESNLQDNNLNNTVYYDTCLSRLGTNNKDSRYSELDSTSKYNYYKNNYLLQNEDNVLLDYNKIKSQNSYLYIRSYIIWNDNNCLYNKTQLIDNLIYIQDITSNGFLKFIVVYINLIIVVIVVLLFTQYYYCKIIMYIKTFAYFCNRLVFKNIINNNKELYFITDTDYKNPTQCFNFKIILKCIILTISLTLVIIETILILFVNNSNIILNTIVFIQNSTCGDFETNAFLQQLGLNLSKCIEDFNNIYSYSITILFLIICITFSKNI